jgi:hypothetical protein
MGRFQSRALPQPVRRLDTVVLEHDRCVYPASEPPHGAHATHRDELDRIADDERLQLVAWSPGQGFAHPSGDDDLEPS